MNPQNPMVFGGINNPQNGMNPMMMPGIMPGMNPMMMPGMNPMMMPGMNPMMMPGMNPMMMPGIMPGVQKTPLTEQQKQQLRMQGYLMGKKMALEKKKTLEAQNPKPTVNSSNINQSEPASGNITIHFKKGGNITKIKRNAESMVAELIDDYFHKTNTTDGNFNFQGTVLTPLDTQSLAEAGLRNGSEIIVS